MAQSVKQPVSKGRRLNLAEDMAAAEMLSISYPLWDKWNESNAKAFFCERMRPEMYTREEYRVCAEILLEELPKQREYSVQALRMAYEHKTGKELHFSLLEYEMTKSEGYYACYLVCTMWQRRQVMIVTSSVSKDTSWSEIDVDSLITVTQKRLADIHQAGSFSSADIRPIADRVLENSAKWEAGESTQYVSTGFIGLDQAIGGFPISEIVTLAGMSGAGKTAMMCNMLLGKGLRSQPVLAFSAEMTADHLLERMAAIHSQRNVQKLRFRYGVGQSDYERFRAAVQHLSTLPIMIDESAAPTPQQIEHRILSASKKPEMVFVDYLEKVDVGSERSEELRVSMIAQQLKAVAKRTGTCIVVLCQYSRDKDAHRTAPKDTWLRYSGKIEQESAVICHWWYPGYWLKKGMDANEIHGYDPTDPSRGTLLITKNRHGKTYAHTLSFTPELLTFEEYESTEHGY
jgi:replicative DNA helicase